MVVADAHGMFDIEVIQILIPIFDCLIIHLDARDGNWFESLSADLK